MPTYKTIEECQIEARKRAAQADIVWKTTVCLYNAICSFIKLLNLFILLIIIWFVTADKIPLVQSLIIYVCILSMQCTVSRCNRSHMESEYVNTKFDIAKQCFEDYEEFPNLSDDDKIKLFENSMYNAVGICKDK